MAEKLAGGNLALALLCSTIPTGALLVILTPCWVCSGAPEPRSVRRRWGFDASVAAGPHRLRPCPIRGRVLAACSIDGIPAARQLQQDGSGSTRHSALPAQLHVVRRSEPDIALRTRRRLMVAEQRRA